MVVQPRIQPIPLLLDDTPERLSCLENELNDLDKPQWINDKDTKKLFERTINTEYPLNKDSIC